ncbi:hypothetical protein GB864_18070, partial [Agromyces sp. MMS17-SY077]|nr:hypothetical protein [Agromyces seonyuensis]
SSTCSSNLLVVALAAAAGAVLLATRGLPAGAPDAVSATTAGTGTGTTGTTGTAATVLSAEWVGDAGRYSLAPAAPTRSEQAGASSRESAGEAPDVDDRGEENPDAEETPTRAADPASWDAYRRPEEAR